jgi:hypothetical protein
MFGASRIETNRNRNFNSTARAYTRTQRPPFYYLINFGLSRQYTSRDVMDEPLSGGDKSAPEHRLQRSCNPFQTDIYYIGNLVRYEFIEVRPASKYLFMPLDSSSLLGMLWFRVHGELDQLDDSRRCSQAPSDRGGAREVLPHSRVFKREQARLSHNVEESTRVIWGNSMGKADPLQISCVAASPRNSRVILILYTPHRLQCREPITPP